MSTLLTKAVSIIVGTVAACRVGSAVASDWATIGHQGKTTLALDVESLDLDVPAGVGKVWARTQFNPPSMYGNKKVANLMSQYEVDCDTGKFALLRSVAYDGSGSVVASSDAPEQMEAPVPDTTADRVVSAVCEALQVRKQAKPPSAR
jgi:hypothetical protein